MASNTSQTLSSSASDSTRATDYDICLSFHDDTRYKFTSHLYSALDRCGLKTFMNLDKQTVHDSKFHVVVFSKKYASSPPCLDQLVEIMNYHKSKQRRVIPIFYNIETSAALQNVTSISDKTPLDADRLKNWLAALVGVKDMPGGYRAGSKRFQADIISDVVDKVLSEINPKVLNITKYPVGLDSRVNQLIIKYLLSSYKSQGVIKLGIYGMGGVGKTTLAKSLYNQLILPGSFSFEGSCFLENFREVLGTERGLECLQEKLINDVLNCKNIISIDNADQGFELIRARLCSRKVVIVIDDVDNAISLDFIIGPFASGSVVIITTRDEEVLDQAEVEPMNRYMVNVLNDADSLTLFTKHAFGGSTPNDYLMMLSRDILRHAGGLPLALEVFGSYLSTQPSKWNKFLIKLESTDHNDNFELNPNDDEFIGTPSFSSSTPPHIQFDVFISFYGKDTRFNFTSRLYHALLDHGFLTFKDDVPAEIISDSLVHAIQDSQTYIVVLSKNYATSSWCLDELVLILNSHKLIIPVFYKIDPSVVRRQSGSYQKAFEKHKTRFDMERVNKWRHALTQVSDITGVHISENRSEAHIIYKIIDSVLCDQVKPKTSHVAEDLVGMDSAIENIMPSLSSDTHEGLIMFGIHGRGGVGKTTLAKAIYNQLLGGNFKGSSFLAIVRENSGSMKGLKTLQEQLINDILKSKNYVQVPNVDQGIKIIEAMICWTKVLVVIDDLQNIKQFESLVRSFASGSVVIITTRDEQMLDHIKVEPRYRYKVNELDDAQSRALFTKYAFKDAIVNNSLMESFSDDILRLAGGLPLALKVFGSYLSTQQSHVGWKSYIEKLQKNPKNTIQKELLISLDAIELEDHMLKQLFLDIACFFIGSKKEEAVKILETYYSFADYSIDILKKKCLLMLNNNDELMMHNLLQDMGREVARNKFPRDEPENHSRLWISEDISKVLTNQMGTEAIECIIHHDLNYMKYESKEVLFTSETTLSFTMETFTRMRRLRFLHLQGGTVSGNFTKTFGDLRWLHWDYCPLTYLSSEFHPQNIVVLEFPRSMIKEWEPEKVFEMLKTLDISYSVHLLSTPDFKMFPRLKSLYLQGCESLEELPDNLGNLTSLKKLNAGQLNVSKLPASIGNLSKLVELSLDHSYNLETLPDTICNLKALESLSIIGCRELKELPNDLGDIISLTKLFAGALNISKLPDSIKNLSQLVELDLTDNKNLESLSDNVCNLTALEVLSIDRCTNLKELPTELGNLISLKVLSAEWLSITELPDSVGNLHKLIELYLGHNKKLAGLPDNICKLTALEILQIDYCESLESLPKDLGKIESLRKLRAEYLKVEELPNSIGHFGKLVELNLCGSFNLTTLPNTISNLSSLEILDLSLCHELKMLPREIWELPSLRELNASGTTLLKRLPHIGPRQISTLPLMRMDLSCSGLTELPPRFSYLSKLENLNLYGCNDLVSIPELPPSLKWILASGCKSLDIFTICVRLEAVGVFGLYKL